MFNLFSRQPLIDADAREWIQDCFIWCLENLGSEPFFNETTLVLPSNKFFPGRADSPDGMASLIFEHVKRYAGISHWPTHVADQNLCALIESPQVEIRGALRGSGGIAADESDDTPHLLFPYNAAQVSKPEALIASFAHNIAHYLAQMSKTPPPGGETFWPQTTELVAIYLGFGVMFANSAFTFRGGCGSCYNPNATRDAYLSELEATYALATFCAVKKIKPAEVTGHLKKHLRGFYKRAFMEIKADVEFLQESHNIRSAVT